MTRPVWLGEDRRRFDHIRKHFQVIKDPRLKANELALYDVLALCAEVQTGQTQEIPQTVFEELTGLSYSTVLRSLKTLAGCGYVEVIPGKGRGHFNRYALLPPPRQNLSQGKVLRGENLPENLSTGEVSPFKNKEFNKNSARAREELKAERRQFLESLAATDSSSLPNLENSEELAAKWRGLRQEFGAKKESA
jgi:DNA-binding transcriptional MocR family regulator